MQAAISNLHPIVIPTPFPVGPVNVYLLDGPKPARIDTGPNTDEAMIALRSGLRSTTGLPTMPVFCSEQVCLSPS